jgi:hypothetical protein
MRAVVAGFSGCCLQRRFWLASGSTLALCEPVALRQGAPWLAALRAELLSFPAGMHDDQVDALSLIGQLLDRVGAGRRVRAPEPPRREDYRPAETWSTDSWKTL